MCHTFKMCSMYNMYEMYNMCAMGGVCTFCNVCIVYITWSMRVLCISGTPCLMRNIRKACMVCGIFVGARGLLSN